MSITPTSSTNSSPTSFSFSSIFETASKAVDTVKQTLQNLPASQEKLQALEASKPTNPNQVLPGKDSNPAVEALLGYIDTAKEVVKKALEPRLQKKLKENLECSL